MYRVLISYDIKTSDDMHTEVKNKMMKKGYQDIYNGYDLPYTTLIKEQTTTQEAIDDFTDVAISLGTKPLRLIAVECNDLQFLKTNYQL